MPTIPLPQDSIVRAGARVSAGRTGEMAAGIGQQEMNIGMEYMQRANEAYQSTVYNKVLTEEQEELQRKIDERKQNAFDEEGNPTYNTLESDIKGYIDESRGRALSKIIDPSVRDKFEQSFATFSASQAQLARSESRKQFIDWSRAEYNDNVERYATLAISADPEMVEKHIADFKSMNDDMLFSGVISSQEHQQREAAFKSNVSVERYRNNMSDSAGQIKDMYEAVSLQFEQGIITESELDAAVKDIQLNQNTNIDELTQEIRANETIDEQTKDRLEKEISQEFMGVTESVRESVENYKKQKKQQITLTVLQAEVDIASGAMTRGQLVRITDSLKEQGYEGFKAALTLEKNFEIYGNSKSGKARADTDIASYVNARQPIPQDISTKAVNDYFKEQAEMQGANTVTDIATLATGYYREVPMVRGTFQAALHESSTEDQLLEAVQAFNHMDRAGNIMPIGKDDSDLVTDYRFMSQYVDMNIPAKTALETIRNNKSMLRSEKEVLSNSFKDKFFEEDRVKKVLDDAVDYKGFLGFGTADLDDRTYAKITDIVRNVYMKSGGDMETTERVAADMLRSSSIGVSSIGAGGERVMVDAPEKILNNVKSDTVQRIFKNDMSAALEGTGVDIEDVKIQPLPNLFRPDDGRQVQRYALTTVDGRIIYKDNKPIGWELPSKELAALEEYIYQKEIPEPIADKLRKKEELTEVERNVVSFREAEAAYKDALNRQANFSDLAKPASQMRDLGRVVDTNEMIDNYRWAVEQRDKAKKRMEELDNEVKSYLKLIGEK